MRARYLVLSLGLVMALGSAGISGAGNGDPSAWFNDPVQGPSPNNDHEVGNLPGGECPDTAKVHVSLLPPGGGPPEASQTYDPDGSGNWGGPFFIPAGLDPATYPLLAACIDREWDEQSPPGQFIVLEYDPRDYTVPAPRDPAKAVEAEVRLTG